MRAAPSSSLRILLEGTNLGQRLGLRGEARTGCAISLAPLPALPGLAGLEELLGNRCDVRHVSLLVSFSRHPLTKICVYADRQFGWPSAAVSDGAEQGRTHRTQRLRGLPARSLRAPVWLPASLPERCRRAF